MLARLWHNVATGHKWQLRGQSVCKPDEGILVWATRQGTTDLTIKARWGWSECLLVCDCGEFRKLEMLGQQVPLSADRSQ